MIQQPPKYPSACGVDLGNKSIKIASACAAGEKKGINILCNEISKRETPNMVGLGDRKKERMIGQQAFAKQKRNFKNTVQYALRVMGAKMDDLHVEEEKKWFTNQLTTNAKGELCFKVKHDNKWCEFTPVQIMAMMMQNIKKTVASNRMNEQAMVFSVPGYFTETERGALLDAAKLADIKVLKLLNETSATAIEYGLLRRAELDATEPRHVVFIDFGHTNTSICLAALQKKEGKIIAEFHDRNCGVRDMDWILYEFYCNILKEQVGEDPSKNKKVRLKILQGLEKQRKRFSSDDRAKLYLEYVFMDEDLDHTLMRDEYLKMVAPVHERFKATVARAKQYITDKKINLHSVEIVGGGSRIPQIQEIISATFGMPCSKTVKPTECIARGCALQAAKLLSTFRVAEYKLTETNIFPIKCCWRFLDPKSDAVLEDYDKHPTLFSTKASFPQLKSVNFPKDAKIECQIYYDPIPLGMSSGMLAHFMIKRKAPKHEQFKTKLKIRLNQNRMVELGGAELIETYMKEEKVPIKEEPKKEEPKKEEPKKEGGMDEEKPKPEGEGETKEDAPEVPQEGQSETVPETPQPGSSNAMDVESEGKTDDAPTDEKKTMEEEKKPEPKFEIKQKKCTNYTQLEVENLVHHQLQKNDFDVVYEIEAAMNSQDRLVIETQFYKNELESRIYDYRDKLDSRWTDYTNDAQGLHATLNEREQWLYGDGTDSTKGQYKKYLEMIEGQFKPIIERHTEFTNIPQRLQQFSGVLQQYDNFVVSTEEKYAHITPEERNTVKKSTEEAKAFVEKTLTHTTKSPRTSMPPTTIKQIDEYWTKFINDNKEIVNKPKPEPKKEEKKEEEKKDGEEGEKKEGEEQKDANKMEEEGAEQKDAPAEEGEQTKQNNTMDEETPKKE